MTEKTRILLVAPSDQFTTDLAARLGSEGAVVTLAGTGAEGLAKKLDGFDIILLDLELPDADGLVVLREMRMNGASAVPVLLLKGEGEPSHILQRGFDIGASGYVIKHRMPHELDSARILEHLFTALSVTGARQDACPFSSRHEFGRCSVFLPLGIAGGDDGMEPQVSCSHLRVGTSDTWRLYPRCAIGDQPARDRYLEDKTLV